MTDRLSPHNIEAEEAVIGSLLIGGDFNLAGLTPDDFFAEQHLFIYQACASLSNRGVSINQITLSQELEQQKRLETIGGVAYLSHLVAICPTHLDLPYYADIVRRLSTYRRLIKVAGQISVIGYNADADLPASMADADELLLDLRKKTTQTGIITPEDRTRILGDRYTELYKAEGGVALKTGLRDLDRELGGGFYAGDLIVVAGRPGMGKSQFSQNLANNIGLKHKVLFCSAEMSVKALGDRDVAALLGVKIQKVRLGGYEDDMYADMTGRVLAKIAERQIYYCDDIPLTTGKIMQAAMTIQLRYGLDIVFIDYLGLLADEIGDNEVTRLGKMARNLKILAEKLHIPVVLVCQLNRALEQRGVKEKRPNLSDLRESGQIEEHADAVLMLYRDSYYKQLTDFERQFLAKFGDGEVDWEQRPESLKDFWISEIIIRKHRQGESNVAVKVWFDRKYHVYRDLVKEPEYAEL